MKRQIIKCPIIRLEVIKLEFCPGKTCEDCLNPKSKKRIKDNDRYSKKAYTEPEKCLITGINYQQLYLLDKTVAELKKKKTSKQALEFYELLYDLGKKGFDLWTHSEIEYQIREIKHSYKKLTEQYREGKDLRAKQVKDYKRILKILEPYRYWLTTSSGIDLESFSYRDTIKALDNLLIKPDHTELNLKDYLSQKKISPEKNNPAHWKLIDDAIKFIVKDLIRIGYAENSAIKITAQLLQYSDRELFKGIAHSAIRERYKYLPK